MIAGLEPMRPSAMAVLAARRLFHGIQRGYRLDIAAYGYGDPLRPRPVRQQSMAGRWNCPTSGLPTATPGNSSGVKAHEIGFGGTVETIERAAKIRSASCGNRLSA